MEDICSVALESSVKVVGGTIFVTELDAALHHRGVANPWVWNVREHPGGNFHINALADEKLKMSVEEKDFVAGNRWVKVFRWDFPPFAIIE